MDIIHNVPPEIIRAIVVASGVDDRGSFYAWKKALSFLWVCRQWRLAAEPILFNTFICDSHSLANGFSNFRLLRRRRCFDKVTRVILREERFLGNHNINKKISSHDVNLMVQYGELFSNRKVAEATETLNDVAYNLDLTAHFDNHESRNDSDHDSDESDYYSDSSGDIEGPQYEYDELHDMCEEATNTIAHKLTRLLPNVTHLVLDFDSWTITNKILAETLITYNLSRLVKLQCSLPVDDFALGCCSRLQSICLEQYNYRTRTAQYLPVKHIKNISLTYDGEFDWGLFRCGISTPISYDNLTRLDIGGHDDLDGSIIYEMTSSGQSAEKPPLVVFPNLRVLVIRDKCIARDMLTYLLQSPIEILSVKGNIQRVFQIYEHDLDKLDRLVVKLRYYYDVDFDEIDDPREYEDEFIQLSNNLFAKTDNIPEVHCKLYLDFHNLNWATINWVHLTHFYISLKGFAGQIMTAISKMPNLVYLDIELAGGSSQHNFKGSLAFITQLNRDSTKPIHTKIEYVTIWGPRVEHNIKLKKAIWSLKQYLPNMKKIKVSRFINEH